MNDAAFIAYLRDCKQDDAAQPKIGIEDVAGMLGVTERQARSRITRLNASLRSIAQISYERPGGYRLYVFDRAALDTWIDMQSQAALVPQTRDERIRYLLSDLVSRADWVTLDSLAEEMFVSKSTLSSDIKIVEERIEPFGLWVERRPHYGLRIDGEEVAKRRCLSSCIVHEIDNKHASSEALERQIEIVSNHVRRSLESIDMRISSASLTSLITHIAIAVGRIKEGHYVPMPFDELDRIKGTEEYAAAKVIAEDIERCADVNLPETEIAYIAIHLGGRRTIGPNDSEGALLISDEVWNVVERIVDEVARLFRYDFHNDLELRMNLARHIVPLATRLKYHIKLVNPILEDIKDGYSLAYSMATVASQVIAGHYCAVLNDDEVGYLALAFALALERKESGPAKKNILVVCASGAGSARLLAYRCRKEFGDFIDTVRTCDVIYLDKVDFSNVDYVFSAVPIKRQLPVPVCFIHHMLDAGDKERIRETLEQGGHVGNYRYLDRNLFIPHIPSTDKREIIDLLLARVNETCDPGENFNDNVWRRERSMPTALGNLVAMPHPIEPTCDETFVCVGVLDRPIVWNDETGQEAQLVMLFSFARGHDLELQGFFNAMAEFLMNEKAVSAVLSQGTWEGLLGELEQYGITER